MCGMVMEVQRPHIRNQSYRTSHVAAPGDTRKSSPTKTTVVQSGVEVSASTFVLSH